MLLEWIAATVVVIVLIVMVGRVTHWVVGRSLDRSSTAVQLAAWRVAPDASVRAVRVFDRVHLIYERGRESTVLESIPLDEFQTRQEDRTEDRPHPLRLLRNRSRKVAGR